MLRQLIATSTYGSISLHRLHIQIYAYEVCFALDFTVGYQVVTQHQNKVNKSISCIVKKKCIEWALVV